MCNHDFSVNCQQSLCKTCFVKQFSPQHGTKKFEAALISRWSQCRSRLRSYISRLTKYYTHVGNFIKIFPSSLRTQSKRGLMSMNAKRKTIKDINSCLFLCPQVERRTAMGAHLTNARHLPKRSLTTSVGYAACSRPFRLWLMS